MGGSDSEKGWGGDCTIKRSIIDHTLNKYDMLFHAYLDLLPLSHVYFVMENNISFTVVMITYAKWIIYSLTAKVSSILAQDLGCLLCNVLNGSNYPMSLSVHPPGAVYKGGAEFLW